MTTEKRLNSIYDWLKDAREQLTMGDRVDLSDSLAMATKEFKAMAKSLGYKLKEDKQ